MSYELVLGMAIGAVAGIIIGRTLLKPKTAVEITSDSVFSKDLEKIKSQLEVLDKGREKFEELRNKLDTERDSKINTWIESNQKSITEFTKLMKNSDEKTREELKKWIESSQTNMKNFKEFSEISDKKTREELKKWMEETEKRYQEQKENAMKLLEEQAKKQQENQEETLKKLDKVAGSIDAFVRTIHGTKRRGAAAEELIKQYLTEPIRAGWIAVNVKTSNGTVEFGWTLEDGKYIPIDSKFPEISEILDEMENADSTTAQVRAKKRMIAKTRLCIKDIQKYHNLGNTIDTSILVLPQEVLDMAPELQMEGRNNQVFLCSATNIIAVATYIESYYNYLNQNGSEGRYLQALQGLFAILQSIEERTSTMDRAITQLSNANEDIRKQISRGERIQYELGQDE